MIFTDNIISIIKSNSNMFCIGGTLDNVKAYGAYLNAAN